MKSRTLYDTLAPVYGRVMPGLLDHVTERVLQRLAAGAPRNVLDIGCGTGDFVRRLADGKQNLAVAGLDISRGMLNRARTRNIGSRQPVSLIQADGCRLPVLGGSIDGVVGMFYLDVLDESSLQSALNEMARIVAPGGRIVLASVRVGKFAENVWRTVYSVLPDVFGKVRPIDYDRYLAEAGLRVLKDEQIESTIDTRVLTLMKVS